MLILNGDLLDLLNHFDHVVEDAMDLFMSIIGFTLEYFYTSIIFLTVFKEFINELDCGIIDEFPIFLLVCEFFDPF